MRVGGREPELARPRRKLDADHHAEPDRLRFRHDEPARPRSREENMCTIMSFLRCDPLAV